MKAWAGGGMFTFFARSYVKYIGIGVILTLPFKKWLRTFFEKKRTEVPFKSCAMPVFKEKSNFVNKLYVHCCLCYYETLRHIYIRRKRCCFYIQFHCALGRLNHYLSRNQFLLVTFLNSFYT